MSHWNYRVIRNVDNDDNEWFTIHEVYYNDKGEPDGVTANPVSLFGETDGELQSSLMKMLDATNLPVIDMAVFDKMEEVDIGDENVGC